MTLELLEERKFHNVFHVSNLKKTLGQHIAPSTELPPLDDEGLLVLILEQILQVQEGSSKQGDLRVSGEMEGITYGGCHMGRRARIAAS